MRERKKERSRPEKESKCENKKETQAEMREKKKEAVIHAEPSPSCFRPAPSSNPTPPASLHLEIDPSRRISGTLSWFDEEKKETRDQRRR